MKSSTARKECEKMKDGCRQAAAKVNLHREIENKIPFFHGASLFLSGVRLNVLVVCGKQRAHIGCKDLHDLVFFALHVLLCVAFD
jgi:hypothetical protein